MVQGPIHTLFGRNLLYHIQNLTRIQDIIVQSVSYTKRRITRQSFSWYDNDKEVFAVISQNLDRSTLYQVQANFAVLNCGLGCSYMNSSFFYNLQHIYHIHVELQKLHSTGDADFFIPAKSKEIAVTFESCMWHPENLTIISYDCQVIYYIFI